MIPKVQEAFGTRIHFDNTLLTLPVYELESNETKDVAQWLQGIAIANELFLDITQEVVVLKGKDFARHSTILQGKLSETFISSAQNMEWDIFDIGGAYVIEYPVAHSDLIETINSVPREPYTFNINITLIEEDTDKTKGIVLDNLVSFATQQFDVLRFKKPLTSLKFPVIGLQKEQAEYLQDNTINLSLTCIAGKEVVQRIDKQTSVLTTSRDALGQVTNQSVTNFISGFIFKLQSFPAKDHVLVNIDLEMSTDRRLRDSDLPEIARKQVINSGYLAVNDVWTCAEFQSKDVTINDNSSFFLPWRNDKKKNQTLLVTLKRIQ